MPMTCGWCLLLALLPGAVLADAPEFDRPGFAFATSTLPPGSWDWEQGLPDLERDTAGGVHSTLYSADTLLRFGVAPAWEIELAGSAWNRLDARGAAGSTRREGSADSSVAVKWAPAPADAPLSLALLGAVTLASGDAAFSNRRTTFSFGATLSRDLGAGRSVNLYANVDRSGGANTWTLAPGFNVTLGGGFGAFVEAGRQCGAGTSSTLAGGGLTWSWHERVQLDLYGRRGLTAHSPDEQAGFGVSVFWN